ncbi:hypothetical protein KXX11_003455, partial [Aspergillus fumigatus]
TSQVRVELPPEDRSTYEQVRDQVLHQNTERSVWRACQKVLADLGYARVEADEDFQLIEADRTEKLVSVSREVLRGLLKARMGLPGKPDHQNTQVRVALQRGAAPGDWRVRVRFLRTVWDSNGDSRTRIVSDTEPYQDFFARLNQAFIGPAPDRAAEVETSPTPSLHAYPMSKLVLTIDDTPEI